MSFSLFVQTDKKGYQHKLADSGIFKRAEATFFNELVCSVTKIVVVYARKGQCLAG